MKRILRDNRIRNMAIALAAAVCFTLVFALRFDFWFDLNDDVLMKDILSGVYTGTPDGHNIQMLFPLGFILSLCYRIAGGIAWYACFLVAVQTICVALLLYRIGRILPCVPLLCAAVTLMGPHMVFYQYSVTCAMLSGTAAFYILTGEGRQNDIISLLLLWIAFLLRSEMMLLTLPMICLAVLFRWSGSGEKRNSVILFVTLVIGIALLQAGDYAAYGSDAWRTFRRLFDNRTELYDFHTIPPYDEHAAFYDEIGLSEEEHALLINYNYGLDESINADTLGAIADYARKTEHESNKGTIDIKEVFRNYLYRLRYHGKPLDYQFPQTDAPWNYITIICYIIICVLSVKDKAIWKPALLFLCRTALWGYILMRGRDPVRITHGLYLVEILLLSGMIISCYEKNRDEMKKRFLIGASVMIALIAAVYLPATLSMTAEACETREAVKTRFDPLFAYMDEHPENFYFMDVYSWVPYTEKLFDGVSARPANRDIMGGWACKSPVYEEKLAAYGMTSMADGLAGETAYYVQETGKDTGWLGAYYEGDGKSVRLAEESVIDGGFTVYSVTRTE
ncbi:MAG: hypothetical protein IJQ21_04430 [Lachnospiraceae bacterium]|nr:hypothetical protein [Lachnospiraceae bacterium]